MAGQALYYGMNALSTMSSWLTEKAEVGQRALPGLDWLGQILCGQKELLNVFLAVPQDRILIVDPMGEYAPLVREAGRPGD